MNSCKFSYLNFINFSELKLWDFKRYVFNTVNSTYPIVKLADYIKEENLKIKPFDFPKEKFEILGVNNKIGLFDAYVEIGKNINQQYKIVNNGFLVYNPYRINVGSIGLKTNEQKYKYISPAYVVFSCKEGLLSKFLYILFKTNKFNELIRENTTGSVRQTLSFNSMGQIKMPLPSIKIQQEIVDKYNKKIKLAEEQEKKIEQLENEMQDYLSKELGLEINENISKNKEGFLSFVSLKFLNRWDVYNQTNQIKSSKFLINKLQDVTIGKPLYGASEKSIKQKTNVRYIRITDINDDGSLNEDIVSAKKIDEKYILNENDFLIARSGNTVGKTFLYKNIYGKCIYAGYLIKFTLDTTKIIPEYLLYYTKSNGYKAWINSNQRANAQPNINSNEYLNSPVIVPPIGMQKEIVAEIEKFKNKIKNLKISSNQNRRTAQLEFEKELFK